MRVLLSLLFLVLTHFSLTAGGLRGTIKNAQGQALEFATIFVKETGSGTTANQEGYYEIRLDPGTYTVIFQYLGYEAKAEEVAIGENFKVLDIVLRQQAFELKQVEVIEGREDPAYTVMRKAIAKASYHRQQLDSYSAQVYMKGSGRVKKTPFYLRKLLKEEGIDTSVAFVSESVSRIEYSRPNKFKETVISIRKQGNDNSTSPNSYIFSSFYQPEIAEAVSPLSPQAFAYYRFKMEGYFVDRGYGVNKIRVTPRSRGENVFEGTIYIVEDWWNIHSLSLKTYKLGIGIQVDQVYAPIENVAWLPVSHKFYIDGKILGVGFEYSYLATASKYKIKLNPDLPADVKVIDEKLDKDLAKEIEKRRAENAKSADTYAKLQEGKELTRKDLRNLMLDYEKEERKDAKQKKKKGTTTTTATAEAPKDTVKRSDDLYAIEEREFSIDTMALKRDSSYWSEIRPIPLTNHEVKGYTRVDSIAKVEAEKQALEDAGGNPDSIDKEQKKKKKGSAFSLGDLITGGGYTIGKNQRLSFESLVNNLYFNPVEGFSLNTEIKYSVTNRTLRTATTTQSENKKDTITIGVGESSSSSSTSPQESKPTSAGAKPSRRLEVGVTPRYGFAREKLIAKGRVSYFYGPRFKWGQAHIEGGRYLSQYNTEKPISEIINTYLNLIQELNYIRLYEKDYLKVNFNKNLRENWKIIVGAEWAKRYALNNTTTQTWFNRDDREYASNTPVADELSQTIPAIEKAAVVTLGVEARPWQKYRSYNGRTQVMENTSPTLTLQYRKGLSGLLGSQTNYDLIDFTFEHRFKIGARGKMDLKINTGMFLNNEYVGFADFKHFNGNRIALITANPVGSFRLLDYYQHSTADKYLSAHAHHQFRKFLFTQIPEVWLMGLKENLFVNYLATPTSQNYFEVGYSIDNIFRIFRVEAAASFQNGKYRDFGVFIGIASNLGFIDFD